MPYPWRLCKADWQALFDAGVGGVVCLASNAPGYDPSPVALVAAVELEDLLAGDPPRNPAAELALIQNVGDLVVERAGRGGGLVVHCAAGRGRTSTVLGAALVRWGHDPHRVVDSQGGAARPRG